MRQARGLGVVDGVALEVVGGNLAAGTRAVPEAHFVDAALEEIVRKGRPAPRRLAEVERGRAGRTPAQHRHARQHRVARAHAAHRLAVEADRLDAVGGDERRAQRAGADAVDVDRERHAIVGRREVHPRVVRQHAARHAAGILGRVLEFRKGTAVRVDAEREVEADDRVGVGVVPAAVVGRAAENVLLGAGDGVLGPHPRLDRELLEEIHAEAVALGRHERGRHARIGRAAEPDALATGGIAVVQRIARRLGRHLQFDGVAASVVVGIIALVLLERYDVVVVGAVEEVAFREYEREERRGHLALLVVGRVVGELIAVVERRVGRARDHLDRIFVAARQRHRHAVEAAGGVLVPDVVAIRVLHGHPDRDRVGRDRRVGHPQRRRVGVQRARRSHIGQQRLFVVPETVAVGIALGRAHQPRRAQRIVDGGLGVVPAVPGVPPRVDGIAGRLGNHVLADNVARLVLAHLAQQRVQAVEQLVEVVHAVVVGIPLARIGAEVHVRVVDQAGHTGAAAQHLDRVRDRDHDGRHLALDAADERGIGHGRVGVGRDRRSPAGVGRTRLGPVGRHGAGPVRRGAPVLPEQIAQAVVQLNRHHVLVLILHIGDDIRARQHVAVAEVHAHIVPGARRIREVAEFGEIVAIRLRQRPVREVLVAELVAQELQLERGVGPGVADLQEAVRAVHRIGAPFAGLHDEIQRQRIEPDGRAVAPEERRPFVVIAEVTHRLHHVFLPVLETVAVPVLVGIADDERVARIRYGAVHAHQDVVAVAHRFRIVIEADVGADRRTDVVVDVRVRHAGREHAIGLVLRHFETLEEDA